MDYLYRTDMEIIGGTDPGSQKCWCRFHSSQNSHRNFAILFANGVSHWWLPAICAK